MTRKLPRWIVKGERLHLVCPACNAKMPVAYDRTAGCCAMIHTAPEGIENATSSEETMRTWSVPGTGQQA